MSYTCRTSVQQSEGVIRRQTHPPDCGNVLGVAGTPALEELRKV